MKKLIFGAVMLTGIVAYAQTGNVGINTPTPDATLDIKPNADNAKEAATSNEGLLVPRLSKTRVANMASPQKSTLVYITNDALSPITNYVGTDVRVEKVDTEGYYYYDGAKWVKFLDTDNDTSEWAYDNATKRVYLKRSDKSPFVNKVFYDTTNGTFVNSDTDPNDIPNLGKSKIFEFTKSSNLESYPIWNGSLIKNFKAESLEINPEDSSIENLTGFSSRVHINPSKDLDLIVTNSNSLIKDVNTNAVKHMYTNVNYATASAGSVGDMYTHYNQITVNNNIGRMGAAGAIKNYGWIDNTGGTGPIESIYSVNNELAIRNTGSTPVKKVVGQENLFQFQDGGTSNITDLIGYSVNFGTVGTHTYNIDNMYGLYLGHLNKGKVSNYAIYSNEGKLRFGDLADTNATSDRIVTVDKDGVLKVGSAASAIADANEWVYDEGTNTTSLKRSGTSPFSNKIYYNNVNGMYVNSDIDVASTVKSKEYVHYNSSNIEANNNSKESSIRQIDIDASDASVKQIRSSRDGIAINSDATAQLDLAIASTASIEKKNSNLTKEILTTASYATARSGSVNNIFTQHNQTTIGDVTHVTNAGAVRNYSFINNAGTGTLDNFTSIKNIVDAPKAGNVTKMIGQNNIFGFGSGNITDLIGYSIELTSANSPAKITNMYGIYLPALSRGTESNYAIYTNAGKVRLGDDVVISSNSTKTTPSAKLDVDGYIKVGSSDTTADSAPQAGMIKFNASTKKFQGYTGTEWVDLH